MTDTKEREDYTQSQERLLQATLEVVDEVGIERATTRLIAGRAGVNIQLIQYYFGGKDGMLEEAQRYVIEKFFGLVGPKISEANTLAEALRAGIEHTWALAQSHPEIVQPDLLLQTVRAARGEQVRHGERHTQDRVGELLGAKMAETGETTRVPMDLFALLVTAGLSGLVLEYRARGETERVGAAVDTLTELLLSLVEPAPA
jgi:AcrR family transcriptional regulator